MPVDIINKKEAEKLMGIPGKTRGESFRGMIDYIREKSGEEDLKRLEKELNDLGYPLDFNNIEKLGWYPIGLGGICLTILRRIFNWKDEDFIDMGDSIPKFSFITKISMGYLSSPHSIFKIAPKYWRKYFTVGDMELVEWNEKEKYGILRLRNFKVQSDHCLFNLGFLRQMGKLAGLKEVTVQETKCPFRGDSYHEFIIRW